MVASLVAANAHASHRCDVSVASGANIYNSTMTSTPVRTILAVVVGDVIFAGGSVLLFYLAKVDPHAPTTRNFILVSVVAGVALALAGGFAGGAIGRRTDVICGMLLAAIIAIGAVISMAGHPGQGSLWSQTAALISAPAAFVGDRLRMKRWPGRPQQT
jgi:drug/metabolite transporter (DMT)-like permease